MKLLFVIPHYYQARGEAHGSMSRYPQRRILALNQCVLSIHQHFGMRQCEINLEHKAARPANGKNAHAIDIVVCTAGDAHLLNDLPLSKCFFQHHPTQAEPLLLGYECHRVMRDALGQYDYYCFLEDDLAIHDLAFFQKLSFFNQHTDLLDLLQPNRFEIAANTPFLKAYVDGDLRPGATAAYQDISKQARIGQRWLGEEIILKRTQNPHSGCFFLNQEQMHHWSLQPWFLDRSAEFIGPLESAATLGVMKTFRIYKPARGNASFLEIQHVDKRFIQLIGSVVSVPEETTAAH